MANQEYDGKKPTRHNKSGYKTKYPYNQAIVSEGGHEYHIDNTPGKERIRIAHGPSGSYIEIQPDGSRHDHTTGNHRSYHKAGLTVTIDENGDVKIAGHQRENISGGKHETSKGDSDKVHGGHTTVVVGGDAKIAVAGDSYQGVKGNLNMNVGGSVSMKVAGDMTMETKGTHTIKAKKITMNP